VSEVNRTVVVKIIELVGVSEKSWHDAVDNAIREAARTVKNLRGVHVKKCTGKIKENRIIEYRATVKISFVVER
jgi:flavin-binding protein dodecin